jgi:hypothetical protein
MITVEKIAYLLEQIEHKEIWLEIKCTIKRTTHPLIKGRVRISQMH